MIERLQLEDTTWGKLIFVGLLQRFWSIVALIAIGLGLLMWFGVTPGIPRAAKLVGLGFLLVGAPCGVAAGLRINMELPEPVFHYLLDFDVPARLDQEAALYELPESDYKDVDVLGEDPLEDWTNRLHAGKGVDIEELTVEEGTWPAAMSKRELMEKKSKISEARNQLEEDAKRGFAIRANAFSIVRAEVRDHMIAVVESFEELSLPDPEASIEDRINEHLENWADLEDDADDVEDELDEDAEAPNGILELPTADTEAESDD